MSRKRPPKRTDTETCPLSSFERRALVSRASAAGGRIHYAHLPGANVTDELRAQFAEDRAELRRFGVILERGPGQTPWWQVTRWCEEGS